MAKNPKIKLFIKTERQLSQKVKCCLCSKEFQYRDLYFYIDESNISITNNSKGICFECKKKK